MKKIKYTYVLSSILFLSLSISFAQWYILPNTNSNSQSYSNTTNSSVWDLSFLKSRQGLFNYFYNKLRNSNSGSNFSTQTNNQNTNISGSSSNGNNSNTSSVIINNTSSQNVSSNSDIECVPLSKDLTLNSNSSDVINLQNFLLVQKYLSVSATGFFGAQTQSAVKAFQLRNNLAVTGIVDLNTRLKIAQLTCGNDQVAMNLVRGITNGTSNTTASVNSNNTNTQSSNSNTNVNATNNTNTSNSSSNNVATNNTNASNINNSNTQIQTQNQTSGNVLGINKSIPYTARNTKNRVYISPDGSAGNSGITDPIRTLPIPIGELKNDTEYIFLDGEYRTKSIIENYSGGTVPSHVTFRALNIGKAILIGTTDGNAFGIKGPYTDFEIYGLTFKGWGDASGNGVITVYGENASNVRIVNNTFINNGDGKPNDIQDHSIYVSAGNTYDSAPKYIYIYNNEVDNTEETNGAGLLHSYKSEGWGAHDMDIAFNKVRGNFNFGIILTAHYQRGYASNIKIRNNDIRLSNSTQVSGVLDLYDQSYGNVSGGVDSTTVIESNIFSSESGLSPAFRLLDVNPPHAPVTKNNIYFKRNGKALTGGAGLNLNGGSGDREVDPNSVSINLSNSNSSGNTTTNVNQTVSDVALDVNSYYRIKSSCNVNLVFGTDQGSKELGTLVKLTSVQDSNILNNVYKPVVNSGNLGGYGFINQNSKLTFGIGGDTNTSVGTPLSQWSTLGTDYQYFKLKNVDGGVTLQPTHTSMYLTGNPTIGGVITQEVYTGNCNQKFIIEKVDPNPINILLNTVSSTLNNSNNTNNTNSSSQSYNLNLGVSLLKESDPRVLWWFDPSKSLLTNSVSSPFCMHTVEAYCGYSNYIGLQYGGNESGKLIGDQYTYNGIVTFDRVKDPLDNSKYAFKHYINTDTVAYHWSDSYHWDNPQVPCTVNDYNTYNCTTTWRSEITTGSKDVMVMRDNSYWIGYAVLLGEDTANGNEYTSLFDLHAPDRSRNGGPSPLGMGVDGGKFTLLRSWNVVPNGDNSTKQTQSYTTPADSSNWHYFVFHVKTSWDMNKNPFLQAWHAVGNGVLTQFVNENASVGFNEPSLTPDYAQKFGLYRFNPWTGGVRSSYTKGMYIFKDEPGSVELNAENLVNLLRSR